MDIRFTNRWEQLSYWELYAILDGLIGLTYESVKVSKDPTVKTLIHEISQELVNRRNMNETIEKAGGKPL